MVWLWVFNSAGSGTSIKEKKKNPQDTCKKLVKTWEFPGGPVIRTSCFGPCPHTTFSACLLPVEHFSQRISLIREGINAETNENNQRGLNNNVVIKHSQGPLVPPQELWIIFWAISCELSIDTKAAGGKVNYRATWLQPGLELPQFRELTGKKWEETDLETEF